jgi:dTDP-4-dehydrorhamnose reductase
MVNVLVTGSNGQLGNEIRLQTDKISGVNFLFHDVDTLDITDVAALKALFIEHKPDFIINCAAYTAVDKAETDIDKAYLINETACENIALVANEFSTKIIHVSTDYVFDGTNFTPYKETDLTNPTSVYGKSKLAGEKCFDNNLNALIIRTSWLYSNFGNNFVKTMFKLGSERTEIKVICDQVGTPTNAADLATAILQIVQLTIKSEKAFVSGVYHFSNEGACSWYDFASEVMLQFGLKCRVIPVETHEYPTPTKRPAYSVLNKSKIKSTFGIQIPWWKDSLTVCINRLKN